MNPLMKNQQNSKEQEAFLHYIENEDIHLKTVDDCKLYLDYSYRFNGYPHHKVIEDLVFIAEDLELNRKLILNSLFQDDQQA